MSNQRNALIILRGLACLMVVGWHVEMPRHYLHLAGNNLSWITFASGMAAIYIFLFLSGYLTGKNFFNGRYNFSLAGIVRYYRDKFIKIIPLYLFSIIISHLFVYPDILKHNRDVLLRLLTFSANDFYDLKGFNTPLWMISMQMQLYLVAPFLYYFSERLVSKKRIVRWFILPGLIVFGMIVRFVVFMYYPANRFDVSSYVRTIYTPFYTNLDVFLSGICLSILIGKSTFPKAIFNNKKIINLFLLTLIFLTGGKMTIFFFSDYLFSRPTVLLLPAIITILTGMLIFISEADIFNSSFVSYRQKRKSLISFNLFETAGLYSYGIYIWHKPVIDLFNLSYKFQERPEIAIIKFVIVVAITFLCAFISYLLIERPFSLLILRRPKNATMVISSILILVIFSSFFARH